LPGLDKKKEIQNLRSSKKLVPFKKYSLNSLCKFNLVQNYTKCKNENPVILGNTLFYNPQTTV